MQDGEGVRNIYSDEQKKLDKMVKDEILLSMKIDALLSDFGYTMEAVLVDGLPSIRYRKV